MKLHPRLLVMTRAADAVQLVQSVFLEVLKTLELLSVLFPGSKHKTILA